MVGGPRVRVGTRIARGVDALVRGPNVTHGYRERPKRRRSRSTTTGFPGCPCAGEAGRRDPGGFLAHAGRRREIFVLSTLEYAPVRALEDTRREILHGALARRGGLVGRTDA